MKSETRKQVYKYLKRRFNTDEIHLTIYPKLGVIIAEVDGERHDVTTPVRDIARLCALHHLEQKLNNII